MSVHVLTTVEHYFDAVHERDKTFEIRHNDRGFQKGDLLHLVPEDWCKCGNEECSTNDGLASMLARISYVFSGDPSLRDNGGILPGYVILGFHILDEPATVEGDAR